ncbi:GNAT family N-acetyltransferase [Paracoccus sp. (in: a-proteobacteria)]|uniref:GNAT family N-acetyltransferase n=1 Tax=Paracoccus sp. TaxID=267 RepID=UPI00396CF64E
MTLTTDRESPLGSDLDLLFQRHAAAMQADTPPESIHMLPRADLDDPAIAFFVIRDQGQPVAMGALKNLGGGHGELKSMHVLAEQRGRGLSRMLLRHLIAHARSHTLDRLSLETGVQPGFAAARGLYVSEGFSECPPFGAYRADPNSVFMTLSMVRDEQLL